MKKSLAVNALKFLVALGCLAGFCHQIYSIMVAFINVETNTGVAYVVQPKGMPLPWISICPTFPFKNSPAAGKITNSSTFQFADMFEESNRKFWEIIESRSLLLGRCYTFIKRKPVAALSRGDKIVTKGADQGLTLFLHDAGLQMWLISLVSPLVRQTSFLIRPPHERVNNIDVSIFKEESVLINLPTRPCMPYPIAAAANSSSSIDGYAGFTKCARDKIVAVLSSGFNCTTFELELFMGGKKQLCKTAAEAKAVASKAYELLLAMTRDPAAAFNCTLPCTMINFVADANYYAQNALLSDGDDVGSNGGIAINLFYVAPVIKRRKEVLMYDTSRIISSLGGSLGLYLGFSCLSVVYFFIDTVAERH